MEGRKRQGRLLTRVSFRYLSEERSLVLLDIDFDAEYQDDIVRTVRKLSELMRKRNIELSKAKELLCGGEIDDNGKAFINWKSLQYEFINVERGDRRKTTLTGLKLRMERILECFEAKKNQEMQNIYSENMQNYILEIVCIKVEDLFGNTDQRLFLIQVYNLEL